MTESEGVLHAQLQKSFDTIKQICVQWFASIAAASVVLDAWSSLFEEYCCASMVDTEATPLSVHPDIDLLTKSKTTRHLTRTLDELQIRQCVFVTKALFTANVFENKLTVITRECSLAIVT